MFLGPMFLGPMFLGLMSDVNITMFMFNVYIGHLKTPRNQTKNTSYSVIQSITIGYGVRCDLV